MLAQWFVRVVALLALMNFHLIAQESPWLAVDLPAAAKGRTLRSICFSGKTGWIVGDKGTVLKTIDGGKTWTALKSGTDATLRCVRFNDDKHGWACGEGDSEAPEANGHLVSGRSQTAALLLITSDGGATWEKSWLPTNFEVWTVETSTAPLIQIGYSGGDLHLDGDICRSQNNGYNFNGDRCFRALFNIRAVDAKRWIAVGSPVSVGFSPTPKTPLYEKSKVRALVSGDGGETWTVSEGSDGDACLFGLATDAQGNAIAVGDKSTILTSRDAGKTWAPVACDIKRDLAAVSMGIGAEKLAVAVGSSGCAIVSADNGATWKAVAAPEASLCAVTSGADAVWAVGANSTLIKSTVAELKDAKPYTLPPMKGTPEYFEAQKPTPAQLARAKTGDTWVMECTHTGEDGVNVYKLRETVIDANDKKFTVEAVLEEGDAPQQFQDHRKAERYYSSIEDLGAMKIGDARETYQKPVRTTSTRLPDEDLDIDGTKWHCIVIAEKVDYGGMFTYTTRQWFDAKNGVPAEGMVQLKAFTDPKQPDIPTERQRLVELKRAK